MTDWARVRADGFAVPGDRPLDDLVAELSAMLRSPDPQVRDTQAYSTLATWIGDGQLGRDELRALGDEMVDRLADPEIQARTFAPLILDSIISQGVFEPSWVPPFERWYVAEEDLRGFDAKLGWLHAVAHGSDLLGALARVQAVEPVQMLRLGIGRLLTPTEYVLRDFEDDRLGFALAIALIRQDLSEEDATSWLDPAVRAVATVPTAGIRPEISNTLRTMRVVYLLADHGLHLDDAHPNAQIPHRDQIKTKLLELFRIATPYYF
ncbi:DUF2785 domain-containing protein [Streptomyces sp. SID13031]|uniref:DUF2785 domain-containing protein n=1 Tax=Streptomyces sp. SID13031 TaxID=2706046 RepID=UPI0013C62D51|nr:DUF2785 domain-containing protein [Streptomyces sp. SID13031]NEA35599.1 DUF2785 domain-containing protein [Streptomyces sp. SID13031]